MAFAYGMATGGQGNGFLVIHRHTGKGHANVMGSLEGIRLAVDSFGIDVDEAHHDSGQRVFEIPFTRIAAIGFIARCKPLLLRAPVDVFLRMPDILASKGEAKGLEPH